MNICKLCNGYGTIKTGSYNHPLFGPQPPDEEECLDCLGTGNEMNIWQRIALREQRRKDAAKPLAEPVTDCPF